MEFVALGKSNLLVSRVGFGAMSLKDIANEEDAAVLIHKAYDAGVNFFDISHTVGESEKRLGKCLHGIRQNVVLATKSCILDSRELTSDLESSLSALQSDYVDLFQYEVDEQNVIAFDEIIDVMERLKKAGKIRHYGLTTENPSIALKAVTESCFEAVQLPFNILTDSETLSVVKECESKETGFVAMRPLYGGIVQNIPLALGFLYQFENVVPLWGVRTVEELEQILYFNDHVPVVDDQFKQEVENIRQFFN